MIASLLIPFLIVFAPGLALYIFLERRLARHVRKYCDNVARERAKER